MLRPVSKVIAVAIVTMINVFRRPALPTTQPNRRYMITPRIVRIDGVKTPPNVPRPRLPVPDVDVAALVMAEWRRHSTR